MKYIWFAVGLGVVSVAGFLILSQVAFSVGARKLGRWFSPVSGKGQPADPDALRFDIKLERITRRTVDGESTSERNSITVSPADGRQRRKETPGTEIRVNGVSLRYGVRVGNYYDRYPSFTLADEGDLLIEGDQLYSFTLRGTNGVVEPLAEVRTPPPLGVRQLQIPKTHPRTRNLDIVFEGLQSPVELVLYRTYGFTDEHGNQGFESGSANDPEAWRKTLKGSGRVTLPVAYLQAPPRRTVTSLGLEFSVVANGTVHPAHATGSRIEALRKLEYYVELTDR